MSSALRVASEVVASWKNDLSGLRSVRGIDEVLKEILAALQKEDAEQQVPLERHKVFSWVESLRGAAMRADGNGARIISAVADDMRATMVGREASASPAAPAPAPANSAVAAAASAAFAPAAPRGPSSYSPPPVEYSKSASPPALYGASAPSVGGGATRFVNERDFAAEVGKLIRETRSELLIVSPWATGLDTLAKDVLAAPPGITIRILTRRPPNDDPEYHRSLVEMKKRGFDVVTSPYIHTRMVVQDLGKLLLGAASAPTPQVGSREVAIVTTDVASVAGARESFLRFLEEARGRT